MTTDERIEFLMQSTASHDRQLGELTEKIDRLATDWNDRFNKLLSLVETDAGTIRSLALMAEGHHKAAPAASKPSMSSLPWVTIREK